MVSQPPTPEGRALAGDGLILSVVTPRRESKVRISTDIKLERIRKWAQNGAAVTQVHSDPGS
jgi:hypothetical protein